MGFDGFVTNAVANQLSKQLTGGKIEKIYQPEAEEIILNIHSNREHHTLYISAASNSPRIHLTNIKYSNPQNPMGFCMLLRKHLQGGRISSICQKDFERIIEISVDTINEMGFSVNKKLIVEIMGKHSNIILIDISTNKIIDSVKRISIDVNRYRQLLPGQIYIYPPNQEKECFSNLSHEDIASVLMNGGSNPAKSLVDKIQGISPSLAEAILFENLDSTSVYNGFRGLLEKLENDDITPKVYIDKENKPMDFHVIPLRHISTEFQEISFEKISEAVDYFYLHKASSNRIKQKSTDLDKAISNSLDKLYLKKQRLSEDLLNAEKAEIYRLNGELITANLHNIRQGETKTTVLNYYDNNEITINLDSRLSPSQNAQMYYKKYNKSKTAIIEKNIQLDEANKDILYLESVLSYIENATTVDEIEELRLELIEGGYMRRRKNNYKPSKKKAEPMKFSTTSGLKILVGKNNKENDALTFKTAGSKDFWFHTKDIPGSHVILFANGNPVSKEDIFEAASIAAFYSKGKNSENVPVDYTKVKNVKKPSGAKPGMVIFVDNKTVYVNPKLPADNPDNA